MRNGIKKMDCCNVGEHKCDMLIDFPEHMKDIESERVKNGLSAKLSIDGCLYPHLSTLWSNGYKTIASCCGHGKIKPTIVIQLESI